MKKHPDTDPWKQLAGLMKVGFQQAAEELRDRLVTFDAQWAKQGLDNFETDRAPEAGGMPGDGEWHLRVVPGAYASFSRQQMHELEALGLQPRQIELSSHHELPDGVRAALREAPVGMGVAWLVDPDGHTTVVLQTPVKPRGWKRLMSHLSPPTSPESS